MGQRLWREAKVVAVVWMVAIAAVAIQVMAKAGNGMALWLSQPIVQNVFHLALAAAGLVVIIHAIGAKMAGRGIAPKAFQDHERGVAQAASGEART